MNTIGKEQALWYSAAIFAGIMLWDIFITSIHFGRRFINHTVMKWISIVAGIVLIMFEYILAMKVKGLIDYCEIIDN